MTTTNLSDFGYRELAMLEELLKAMNGDKLESWYFLSYHGNEGFLDELLIDYENGNIQEEDWEQLADICEVNGEEEKAEEIRNRLNGEEEEEED